MNLCLTLSAFLFVAMMVLGYAQDNCETWTDVDPSYNKNIPIRAMKWFETPSVVRYGAECTGEEALGMESGAIKHQQITAYSQYSENCGPENARLNHVADGRKMGAWSAKTNDLNQWLQVDLGRDVKITKFVTQGRQDCKQWVKSYTLSFSTEKEPVFQTYQESGQEKVFTGNIDQNSKVTHSLLQPITARYVKIIPKTWNDHISMRAEFYGCVLSERYRVVGRVAHMDFIEENLRTKHGVNFQDEQERPNYIELEVLADTVYVKGNIQMRGIKKLTVFSRRVFSAAESQLDLSAPTLTQPSSTQVFGDDGQDGKDGAAGPVVEIFADKLRGYLNIVTNGGNGNNGQNGREGKKGDDQGYQEPPKTEEHCRNGGQYDANGKFLKCTNYPGKPGIKGRPGQNGGYAGRSGNGGDAGHLTLYVNKRVRGKVALKTCAGKGASAAINGKGGEGGLGSQGGTGVICIDSTPCLENISPCLVPVYECKKVICTPPAANGEPGTTGTDGKTPDTPGSDGEVTSAYIQKFELTTSAKQKYPLVLLKLMKRRAEDLIWANNIEMGGKILKFIYRVTEERDDASSIREVAQRRLGFLNKDGIDRFGNIKLFAPLKKSSAFKKEVESVRDIAMCFQGAYNGIKDTMNEQDNLREVFKALPDTATVQVRAQKARLEAAKEVSIKEKELYKSSVTNLEGRMKNFLSQITRVLPDTYEKAQFNTADLIAVLKGLTGFVKGIAGKDPFEVIDNALDVAGHFASKCYTGTLTEVKDKVNKWLKFGKEYSPLDNPNDLDFEKMDVASVPEIMKADLEMNKEGLAADLVCLLEERALPRDKAKLEELIENFFIAGAARIDLIAKIMTLDNDMGTLNFDIDNLEDTATAIENLGNSPNAPIAENIQQNFLDDLLQTYRQMETRFAKKLYSYYKSFEFQSLWDVEEKIAEYQRLASSATDTAGKLQGVTELQKAIAKIDELESSAQNCYTSYRVETDIHKWSFDSSKDGTLFDELYNGQTRFTLKMPESGSMYNMRLLKMYVELYSDGDPSQYENIPAKVYLRLRHLSASYFRDGYGKTKEFRQKLVSERTFHFNRFEITDTEKCNERKKQGERNPIYCMDKNDHRLKSMCCHYLSDFKCEGELQLGAEACKSLFGTYELSIPIDDTLDCTGSNDVVTDKNCKDFQRTMFTKMNVWVSYFYWSGGYPKGPNDGKCTNSDSPSKSKVLISKKLLSLKHKPKWF